ncbi:2-hydroxyacyl-CoA lyase 2-like isoform X2 [Tachypleus tridentatus]|uniref:2-hydroxyacyl-CoA lyase 2-like isoform X2 n=1 Tax=Tachypleus tridentatus TaxID=6853 RepID=UPI003FD50781
MIEISTIILLISSVVCIYLLVIGIALIILAKRLGIFYQLRHSFHDTSVSHGGELVAHTLKEHGVKFIFTLVGGHISPILVAAEKCGIRVVDTRHEATAVFAADAVARLSGSVGVAAVTAGPGLTNTVTAVKNAQMAESPVLVISGASASILKGRGALQDIDQMSLMKTLCKFTKSVTTVRDIIPTLKKAIKVAQSGTPGPVFIEYPIDVLYPFDIVKKEIGLKEAKTFTQQITNWYLQKYLGNIFAGGFEQQDMTPLPVEIPQASYNKVQTCAELVAKAKRPIMIVGSQAVLPSTPPELLKNVLESLGIPCFLGGMSRGMLGRYNKLLMRHRRKDAIKDADLVILAGAVCDFRLSYGRVLNKKSKIIVINRDKKQMLKNSDIFWKPTVAVQGDVGSFLVKVSNNLKGYKCDEDWIIQLKERDEEKEKHNRKMANHPTEHHLNPMNVLFHLEEVLGDKTIMIVDGGDFVGTAAYILRPRGPLKWLDPGAFGTLGVGAGFALGAKLCFPDHDVVIIYGDGSLGFSIVEYDTFKRHKYTPYHQVVEGFGAKGMVMLDAKQEEETKVFEEARDIYKQGQCVLINVLIGKTKFREGSISV